MKETMTLFISASIRMNGTTTQGPSYTITKDYQGTTTKEDILDWVCDTISEEYSPVCGLPKLHNDGTITADAELLTYENAPEDGPVLHHHVNIVSPTFNAIAAVAKSDMSEEAKAEIINAILK